MFDAIYPYNRDYYKIDFEIAKDLLVDFAPSTPTTTSRLDTVLGYLKFSVADTTLTKFSERDLQTVKLTAKVLSRGEKRVGWRDRNRRAA